MFALRRLLREDWRCFLMCCGLLRLLHLLRCIWHCCGAFEHTAAMPNTPQQCRTAATPNRSKCNKCHIAQRHRKQCGVAVALLWHCCGIAAALLQHCCSIAAALLQHCCSSVAL